MDEKIKIKRVREKKLREIMTKSNRRNEITGQSSGYEMIKKLKKMKI